MLRRFLCAFLFFFLTSSLIFASPAPEKKLSDEELLEEIQKNAFQYFALESHPMTGLVYDLASNGSAGSFPRMASMAATGFGLTAYGVGVERGWMDFRTAKEKTKKTLEFLLNHAEQERGFFYHFVNPQNGKRAGNSELSPIDTAWLLAGVLFAAEYYEDVEIRELSEKIYERIDWTWMLNQGKTLALAWTPEQGFNKRRWDHYDECLLMYLVAIGSLSHPIPVDSWKAIARPVGSYKGHRMIAMPPLFTHQYSHIWIDFKNQSDEFADYFQNSVEATLAQREFAIDEAKRFSSYSENSWGLTASNGPFGYKAYGAPPGWAQHDGTVAPTACISSIVFAPTESLACAHYFYENLKGRLWGKYGFSDAFNLDKDWFDDKVIGIDQGAILLMIENYRSGLIWKTMAKNSAITRAKKEVGFKEGTKELSWPDPPVYRAPFIRGGIQTDGYLKDWPNIPAVLLNSDQKESGDIENEEDFSGEIRFAWDDDSLYVMAKVKDQSSVTMRTGTSLWQDDAVEIFVDPDQDGLFWNGSKDYQIGFRAPDKHQQMSVWSWFQGGEDPTIRHDVSTGGFGYEGGYVVEAALHWKYLHFEPKAGGTISVSASLHDSDRDKSQAKLHWFFRNEEVAGRFILGKIILEPAEDQHSLTPTPLPQGEVKGEGEK